MIEDLFSVRGKTVLVTGGAHGLGRMIANGFVEGGASVVITARKGDAVASAVEELSVLGGCRGIAADLATPEGCAELASALDWPWCPMCT